MMKLTLHMINKDIAATSPYFYLVACKAHKGMKYFDNPPNDVKVWLEVSSPGVLAKFDLRS